MPNHMRAVDAAIELFSDDFYNEICNYKNVLDLGWYCWESAIKLGLLNNHVDVYEAHPENFKYLKKNIIKYKNINWYNYAVN